MNVARCSASRYITFLSHKKKTDESNYNITLFHLLLGFTPHKILQVDKVNWRVSENFL